jgi:hypothetical protein
MNILTRICFFLIREFDLLLISRVRGSIIHEIWIQRTFIFYQLNFLNFICKLGMTIASTRSLKVKFYERVSYGVHGCSFLI